MSDPSSKPPELVARDHEWDDLCRFVEGRRSGMSIAVVYGRRRQGKSYLLRRLCEAYGGRYVMAVQEERLPALRRFVTETASLPGHVTVADWDAALRLAVDRPPADWPLLLVIDELPYLLRHSPEIPSLLQRLYDEVGRPVRVVLCGSAISVMSELLSGTKALRGRASVDLCLRPFDYRTSARYWGAVDPRTAFAVDAVMGGTPGYRDLVDAPVPANPDDLGSWLATSVLNPSHALFTEADYLLREDPRLGDRAVHHSILAAIADGARTPTAIGARIGRDRTAVAYPLRVLRDTGFVRDDDDLLHQRKPSYHLVDPIIRFVQLVVAPRPAVFEDRRWKDGWRAAGPAFSSGVLAPHFEHLAREWVRRFAERDLLPRDLLQRELGEVGRTVVNDPSGRAVHEIDVAALPVGERRQSRGSAAILLGEAKAGAAARGVADLHRLERIRELLLARGSATSDATLAVFGLGGFDADLVELAGRRRDVLLVDLAQLYAGIFD